MGLGKHIFVRTVIVPVAACLIGQSACVHQMAAPRRAPKVEDPSSPVITERHSKRVVRLSGVVVRTEADALTGDEVYDAERLFHLAGEADRNGDTAVAKEIYAKLLREFGKSAYADVARFNLGLLHEESDEYNAAARRFLEILNGPKPTSEDGERLWIDTHFRLGVCFAKLKRWWRSVAAFDALLEISWVEGFDRLEAMVGRGIALQEAGDPEAAEIAFGGVLRFFRTLEANASFHERGLVAEAAFRLGEIARHRYLRIELAYPLEKLRALLEQKCTQLLSAQNRYLRAIRFGDPELVAIAGIKMGSLYEDLYVSVTELETPVDLTPEQVEIYEEEVRKKVAILLKKAIRIYEKSLMVGRRLEASELWLERLETALERLKSLYLASEAAFLIPRVRVEHRLRSI